MSERRRILCLDGGGIKGVFPTSFLATVEEATGGKVAERFDLIVGTSTGGILAIGLALGFPAREILGFYETLGPLIFGQGGLPGLLASVKQIGRSKYGNETLADSLGQLLGERRLSESLTRLLIPSFNLETGEIYVFRHHPETGFAGVSDARAVDAALGTAAAPTFFPTHRTPIGTPLVDGAVWANNPVAFAITEAIGDLGWSADTLDVLSLGCTQEAFSAGWARSTPMGAAYWGAKASDLFLTAQSSAALVMASRLVPVERLVRINPTVARRRFGLDKVSEIPSLAGLGDSEARKALAGPARRFFHDGPR